MKIHVDRSLNLPGHEPALFLSSLYEFDILKAHREANVLYKGHWPLFNVPDFFEFAAIEDSDAVLFPWKCRHSSGHLQPLLECIYRAAEHGKKVIVEYFDDQAEPLNLPGEPFVFRPSLYRSLSPVNEMAIPGFHPDLVSEFLNRKPVYRKKRPRPAVGFCGYTLPEAHIEREFPVDTDFAEVFATCRDESCGRVLRAYLLKLFGENNDIESSLIRRNYFQGGKVASREGGLPNRRAITRREFFNNLMENDYILCPRGAGNFSFRLYETLCAGRIPVIIDTDCLLPFHDDPRWRELAVWIDLKDLHRADEILLKFHADVPHSSFIDLQRSCRKFWLSHLCHGGFLSRLPEILARFDLMVI